MGCCYSYEEEVDPEPRPVYTIRRPTSTATTLQSNYDWRPTPTATSSQINYDWRPTPTATSSRSNYDSYNKYRAVPTPSARTVPIIRNQVSTPKVRAVVIKPTQEFKPRPGALYGEYKCSCKYFWVSRLSWRDKYQQCKRCKSYVRPRNQRELRPSDFTRGENDEGLEHPQALCEMCKQVGGYCGKYKS